MALYFPNVTTYHLDGIDYENTILRSDEYEKITADSNKDAYVISDMRL